jgi:hypothetical protein
MPDVFSSNDTITLLPNELKSQVPRARPEPRKVVKMRVQTFDFIRSWLSLSAQLLRKHPVPPLIVVVSAGVLVGARRHR